MAALSNGMTQRTLKEIFEWIDTHQLALPELQRPSVWAESKTPRLLSSVYQDYPFGIFLLWTPRPEERIRCKPFAMSGKATFDPTEKAAYYLIDGQQRLTAFYKSLHNLPSPKVPTLFNISTEEFELPNARYSEKDGWFSLPHLLSFTFSEIGSFIDRHSTDDLGRSRLNSAFERLRRLLPEKVDISFYNVLGKPYWEAAEIFERINLGTPVRKSQIVLGKLSTRFPGIVEEVEAYLESMRRRHGNEFDLDLVMMALATIATEYADLDNLLEKFIRPGEADGGASLTDAFKMACSAIEQAFSFISEHLCIDSMKYFRSQRTLICLAYLCSKHKEVPHEPATANKLAYWTALALLTGHHNDFRDLKTDIRAVRDSSSDVVDALLKPLAGADWRRTVDQLDDPDTPISRNNVLFGFMYGLVRARKAVSFITTGFAIQSDGDPDALIHEHHIYPEAQIDRERRPDGTPWRPQWKADIGNLTFLLAKDNMALKDPHISYLHNYPSLLPAHLIHTAEYKEGQYAQFLRDRRGEVKKALLQFIGELQEKAASVPAPPTTGVGE